MTDKPTIPAVGASVASDGASSESPTISAGPTSPIMATPGHGSLEDRSAEQRAAAPRAMPERIGSHRLLRKIGEGGMGVVYEAVQEPLGRAVAVKVLTGRRDAVRSEEAVRRFEYEASLLARMRHPGVAQVYEAGVVEIGGEPTPYFAMELAPGALRITDYCAGRGRMLSVREKAALFAAVCDAVQHAHSLGVVHRDLKPANILVDADGKPKVIDFGLARAADFDNAVPESPMSAGSTRVSGTLKYMSPEQVSGDGRGLSAASDVYSLGVTLYEVMCGRRPNDVPDDVEGARRVIIGEAPAPMMIDGQPADADLAAIVRSALEKDPTKRMRSAAVLADHLRRYAEGRPLPVRDTDPVYAVVSRSRVFARRRPIAAWALATLAAAGTAELLAVPAIDRWTVANSFFERLAAAIIPTGSSAKVRVIALDDSTNIEALAASLGEQAVTTSDMTSLRRLHGRLMQRLAESRPAVVAWDIFFTRASEHDAALEAGAKALTDAGVGVVFGSAAWRLTPQGLPMLTTAALKHGAWGVCTAETPGDAPWRVDLAMSRTSAPVMLSLTLATMAQLAAPGSTASAVVDAEAGTVTVRAERVDPSAPTVRIAVGAPIVVRATSVTEVTSTIQAREGAEPGDVLPQLLVSLPDQQEMDRITMSYGEAMVAPPDRLRDALGKAIVLIADFRGETDLHTAVGRRVRGVYAHAAALDALLSGGQARQPTPAQTIPMTVGAAGAGALAGVVARRRRALTVALLGMCGLAAVASLGLLAVSTLVNPLIPMVAIVSAGALMRAALGECRADRTPVPRAGA